MPSFSSDRDRRFEKILCEANVSQSASVISIFSNPISCPKQTF